MGERQISASNRDWLNAEVELWVERGICDNEQSRRILDVYENDRESASRRSSIAAFLLSSVASLLVGAAVLLVIGFNWEAMPAAMKVVVILGITFGTHALGYWLRYHRDARLGSETAFFLGSLFFGCGIWLVAQIFNVNSHYPTGFWLWAVGVLPLALCLDTLLLHALVVALLAIWVGTEILGEMFRGPWWWWRAIPRACLSLPLLCLPGVVWAYRRRSPMTLSLYLPLFAWWLALQPLAWRPGANLEFFILYVVGAIGALFLIIAEAHADRSHMAIPFRLYGGLFALGALVPLTFPMVNGALLHVAGRGPRGWIALFGFALVIAAMVLGLLLERRRLRSQRPALGETGSSGAETWGDDFVRMWQRQWLPVGFAILIGGLCVWNGLFSGNVEPDGYYRDLDTGSAVVVLPTIATNLAMLAFATWLLRVGFREDRLRPFGCGVAVFLLWTVMRYVDLFGAAGGMLGAALLFLICGVALFGVSRFWIDRKQVQHVLAD